MAEMSPQATPVAFCPQCGHHLRQVYLDCLEQSAACDGCGVGWFVLWDQDADGGWGVQGFQCDNQDRTAREPRKYLSQEGEGAR